MLDDHIEELEAGWRHLLDGLRAIVKVLRDENELLRARLDERRMMQPPAPAIVQPPEPKPDPVAEVVATPAPIIVLPMPGERKRRRYDRQDVEKICEECKQPAMVGLHARFCRPCRTARLATKIKRYHEDRPDALTKEVDMRIAVSR